MQHLIHPAKPTRPLNRLHIQRLLHHANYSPIPPRIRTNAARIRVSQILTTNTKHNRSLHLDQRIRQVHRLPLRRSKHVISQPLRTLRPNPRQPMKRLNQPIDRRIPGPTPVELIHLEARLLLDHHSAQLSRLVHQVPTRRLASRRRSRVIQLLPQHRLHPQLPPRDLRNRLAHRRQQLPILIV